MALESLVYSYQPLGQDHVPFTCYKIKTMYNEAERELHKLAEKRGYNGLGKLKDDPRIIKSRKLLRKFWIDELPQIMNLALGNLKLVGIRPRSEQAWESYPKEHKERALKHKPGLMGVPYATDPKEREDLLKIEQDYLNLYEKSPLRADIYYFLKISHNILLNGKRSE